MNGTEPCFTLIKAAYLNIDVGIACTAYLHKEMGCTFNRLRRCRYFCYTCGLVDSKGCCSACAQVCHAGHDLVYSTHSRFFCDCGSGVPRYGCSLQTLMAAACVDPFVWFL